MTDRMDETVSSQFYIENLYEVAMDDVDPLVNIVATPFTQSRNKN